MTPGFDDTRDDPLAWPGCLGLLLSVLIGSGMWLLAAWAIWRLLRGTP